jgi:hypothetical protein
MRGLVWLAEGEFARAGLKRRGGRWVPVVQRKDNALKLVAEWCAITVLACAIVDAGGWLGFTGSKAVFDAQSRAYAVGAMNQAEAASPAAAQARIDDCVGGARYAPLEIHTVVVANYTCEIRDRSGLRMGSVALERGPDDWRVTRLYIG